MHAASHVGNRARAALAWRAAGIGVNTLNRSIFYLDDDASQLEVFSEMFGAEYDVRTSASPAEARRMLTECAADVIISDQSMPEVDGTDFLREAALVCPGSVRILLSGYVSLGDVLGELSLGVVNVFVPKPWDESYMRQVLERALSALDSPEWLGGREGERRIAPRHEVKLETRVLMLAEGEADGGVVLTLSGHTRDVSESGLGLVVTANDRRALADLGDGYTLRLVLTVPSGPVELTVTPVRFEKLGQSEDEDFLIGASIIDMSGRDRVRFMGYVRELARRRRT